MSHLVIPAPVRFDRDAGQFTVRSGMKIAYTVPELAPVVGRFCAEAGRRTGLRLTPVINAPAQDESSIRIELATVSDLPAPRGLSPTGDTPPDERYDVTVSAGQVVLTAAQPVGVARGLTTLIQLLATTPEPWIPAGRFLDAPRYAWRGLSLDLARTYFTLDEVRRVIDLLALYKLNVLHVHLTDDQGWRLPVGQAGSAERFYPAEDLRALVAYAADRFVTVVPEVDMPGHVSALIQMHPELGNGQNHGWLDPALPATFPLAADIMTGVAGLFPSPYLHLGGDEPWGMPRDRYVSFVRWARDLARSLGKQPVGWQESARAGLGPDDIVQYWLSGIALSPAVSEKARAKMDADLALAKSDVQAAVAASVPVIVSPQSHCYLDVPYAEPPADPAQAERYGRVGLRNYAPMTVAESFSWEPAEALGRAAQVAGVEAAIWTETVSDFDDLSFLLLPRLPGVADKAWSDQTTWKEHRGRLARHARLWVQDSLLYYE